MTKIDIKRALTIAGSDSGGGAGIQADIKTFSALGVYASSVLTAVTAQNTLGVKGILALPAEFVCLQFDAVMSDIGADAVKTGMLANADIITAVAEGVRRWAIDNLVVDPVMVATSGDHLLQQDARDALIGDLLPLARVVTPNLPEAQALTGLAIRSPAEMREAALALHSLGARNVLVKGGHLQDEGERPSAEAIDILFDGKEITEFSSPRIATHNTHGTGCTLASAIAAGLAKGQTVRQAVGAAKDYILAALDDAQNWQIGRGHGPVNHFWRFWASSSSEGDKPRS